jgi:hypothetical protein
MKNQIIYVISYVVEGEDIDDNEKVHKPLFANFPDRIELGNGIYAERKMKQIQMLVDSNSTKCSNCCERVTDSEKSQTVVGLPFGTYIDDKIYCPKCYLEQRSNK